MSGRWRLLLVAAVIGCAMIVGAAQQPPAAGGPTPAAGASYTAQQAERGRVAYAQNCSGCHGPNLDDGPSDAPPLTGVNFVTFWGSRSAGDLFNYIMDTMPPAAPGSLGDETTVNVVAYILQRMGAQAGTSGLDVKCDDRAQRDRAGWPWRRQRRSRRGSRRCWRRGRSHAHGVWRGQRRRRRRTWRRTWRLSRSDGSR